MLLLTSSGGIKVVGGAAFLFLFFGGGEANMSGSMGPKSVSGGSLSKVDEGICNIYLDSVFKQISASKYGWRGLVRFSYEYSGVTEGGGRVFKFSSTVITSGSTVGESGCGRNGSDPVRTVKYPTCFEFPLEFKFISIL